MPRGRSTAGPALRGPIACCVLAIAALSLGPSAEATIRSVVRDAARPGFLIERHLTDFLATLDLTRWPWTAQQSAATSDPVPTTGEEQASARREVRSLRAALSAARRESAALERSLGPVRAAAATPTVSVERVSAQILHTGDGSTMPGGLLIGAGRSDGAAPGQLAVEPVSIAAGTEAGVSDGQLVLAGAAVVGRTDEVGLWTATVVPVTHPEFHAHVSLIRETDSGPVAGAEGILEGDGRGGCLVRYLPSTASVSVGDHVYSVDPTGRLPQPFYYGRIEHAELRRGAPHWKVTVRPAADPAAFEAVHILVPAEPDTPHVASTTDIKSQN